MFITITLQINDQKYDIRLDDGLKLSQAIDTLQSAGRCGSCCADFFRSRCTDRLVSAYRPLAQQGIYSGDLLQAVMA